MAHVVQICSNTGSHTRSTMLLFRHSNSLNRDDEALVLGDIHKRRPNKSTSPQVGVSLKAGRSILERGDCVCVTLSDSISGRLAFASSCVYLALRNNPQRHDERLRQPEQDRFPLSHYRQYV